MQPHWFVIQTYSGYENKVQNNLKRRIASMAMDDHIFRVIVPTHQAYTIKNGQKKLGNTKAFPGYVLIEMILTDKSQRVVRETPAVIGFVGADPRPVPLTAQEVSTMLGPDFSGILPLSTTPWTVGQDVLMVDGAFEGLSGQIEEIIRDRERVKLAVSLFGRNVSVELDFTQIQ